MICPSCQLLQWSDAAVDCTSALAIDGGYVKVYMRRASAYEASDDLERALADYKKARICHVCECTKFPKLASKRAVCGVFGLQT